MGRTGSHEVVGLVLRVAPKGVRGLRWGGWVGGWVDDGKEGETHRFISTHPPTQPELTVARSKATEADYPTHHPPTPLTWLG